MIDTGRKLSPPSDVSGTVVVFIVVLAASLFGILTRPVDSLATLWPANAVLLGLMARDRRFSAWHAWPAAILAYLIADFATGGEFALTLGLTVANIAGVAVGFVIINASSGDGRSLRRPGSVLRMFLALVGAAAASATFGCVVGRWMMGKNLIDAFEFWFVTELVNGLIFVPVMLTFAIEPNFGDRIRRAVAAMKWTLVAPFAALVASMALAAGIGGPGAMSFPIPAMIWCAISYRISTTALLTMIACSSLLILWSFEGSTFGNSDHMISSVRLGVALTALAPLTVASVREVERELFDKLSHAADHDLLTHTLSRRAFASRASECLQDLERSGKPGVLMMIDIDKFKEINDRHGHGGGDAALIAFANLVRAKLQEGDLFGRVGGEEFAIFAQGLGPRASLSMAEGIRLAINNAAIAVSEDTTITMSASIGVSLHRRGDSLERMMAAADGALYRAKAEGRNRVIRAAA